MEPLPRRDFLARTAAAGTFAFLPPADLEAGSLRGQEPVRLGLIGAGRQGRAILGELGKLETARVAAVCDVDPSRLRGARRRAPQAEALEDWRRVLDLDLDAVVIATPTHLHREPAEAALQAGLHVFCEAPLAHTAEDARALARAARSSDRVFQTGLQGRSNPVYQLARSFARSGALRDLVCLEARWNQKTSWRFGVGDPARDRLLDWRLDPEVSLGLPGEVASHQVDTVSWFVDRLPLSVRGRGALRLHRDGREIPDTVTLEFLFPDGLVLLDQASLASSYERSFELFRGSNASIRLASTHGWMFKEADSATQGWEVYANRQRFHQDEGITLIADATKLARQGKLQEGVGLPNPPLFYALRDFLASVAGGAPVAAGAEEGLRAALMGIAAHEAVSGGSEIALGPLFEGPRSGG